MTKRSYTIASVRDALEVLEAFTNRETWSLAELSGELALSKSRVFRILSTLEEGGYLNRESSDGRYKLGMRLFTLGNAAVQYEQLRWQSLPPLQALAEQTGETVHVGILYEGEVVCVQLVESRHVVRMHSWIGKRSAAHAGSLGKALPAHYPEAEIDAYVHNVGLKALTPHTLTDPAGFKAHLRDVREQGYAIDNEELETGLRCVGTPITDHTARVIAAVSISGPSFRPDMEQATALVPKVKECARTISRILGSPTVFSGAG